MSEKLVNFIEVNDEVIVDPTNPIELACNRKYQQMAEFLLNETEKIKQITLLSFGVSTQATKSYIVGPSSVLSAILTSLIEKQIDVLIKLQNSSLTLPNEENSAYLIKKVSNLPKLFEYTDLFPDKDYLKVEIYFADKVIILTYLPSFPPFKSDISFAAKANSWNIIQNPGDFLQTKTYIALHTDNSLKEETKVLKILAHCNPEFQIIELNKPQKAISIVTHEDEEEEQNDKVNNANADNDKDKQKNHHRRHRHHHHHHHKGDADGKTGNHSKSGENSSRKGKKHGKSSKNYNKNGQGDGTDNNLTNAQKLDIEDLNDSNKFSDEDGSMNSSPKSRSHSNRQSKNGENSDVKMNKIRKVKKTKRIKMSQLLENDEDDIEEESDAELVDNTELTTYDDYSYDYSDSYEEEEEEHNDEKKNVILGLDKSQEEEEEEELFEPEETIEDKIHEFAFSVELNIPALQTNAIYATLFNQLFYEKWRGGALKRAETALRDAQTHIKQVKTDEITNLRNLVESKDLTIFVAREEKKLRLLEAKAVEVMEMLFSARAQSFADKNPGLLKTYKLMCAESIELMRTIREKRAKIRSTAMDLRVLQMRRVEALDKQHKKALKMTNEKQRMIQAAEEKETLIDEIEGLTHAKQQLMKQKEKILSLIEQKKAAMQKTKQ